MKYRTLIGVLLLVLLLPLSARAQSVIPPVWDVLADDFESGNLNRWDLRGAGTAALSPGNGYGGSTALSVAIGAEDNFISKAGFAKAEEAYLTFWFDPNSATIPDPFTYWPPENAVYVAGILGTESWWPPMIALYVRYETGVGYKGFLTWPEGESNHYDYEQEFDIADGWQKISIGCRVDEWVGIWIDDQLVLSSTEVEHLNTFADVAYLGKMNDNDTTTPSGALLFDGVAFQVPRVDALWVDAGSGSDDNDGTTSGTALETIQRAADLAGPGTTVHILPGVYRETVLPALSGSSAEQTVYRAESGPGTVALRGSEPSSSLTWTPLAANTIGLPAGVDPASIYYADLSSWELEAAPRFVVELDGSGEVLARLPLAREPDWQVATEWKTHEFWWAADGGSTPATCDPATDDDANCDYDTRSTTQLTDRTDDAEPAGIEAGNLATLGDLTGATLVAIDTYQGHYVYRRTVTAHDLAAGRITVDEICEHDNGSGNPGLGWGSKYYVENKPALLDSPGEWWYDTTTGFLYLWPRGAGNPASQSIEISRREHGFNLKNRSYITLDGLTIELLDGAAVYLANWTSEWAYDDVLRNLTLRYANWGVHIEQSVRATSPPESVIDGLILENSEIAYIDTFAVRLIDWWEDGAAADSFTRPGVLNTIIRDNEMHHLGFRTDGDNAVGASFGHANQLRFERNYVHHVAHNGIQFSKSVIQSDKTYGFTPGEIKTGGILIRDNVFEKACQLTTDCGGLKFWGSPPDGHVFRDVLVTGNVFRDSIGWTYISEKRGRWSGGDGSPVQGMGAFGLYVDHASGIHAYRNIAYNNSNTNYPLSGVWRDGQIVYVNNVSANSLYGFVLGGSNYDTHGNYDTRLLNNIVINNEAFGMSVNYSSGRLENLTIDYNLYHNNGWGGMWHAGPIVSREDGSWDPYETLAEVQAATPWEAHGVEAGPAFFDYDVDDHEIHDGSRPDFHLTGASTAAIDQGTVLPASLVALLDAFDVPDGIQGSAPDIGRYEAGFSLIATPASRTIVAGGTALYVLSLDPPDVAQPVTLTLGVLPTDFSGSLSSLLLMPGETVTLALVHNGASVQMGTWYTVSVTGVATGFTQVTEVSVLVGGTRVYLPLVIKQGD